MKEMGLLGRTPVFYSLVGAAILLGFGGAIAGFIPLGDSWFRLLIAAALGILFTQVAFLAHDAAHRQILSSGPANLRLARILAGTVGMSYSWWDSKHTRHHGNPNKVGSDPARDKVKGCWTELSTVRFAVLLVPLFLLLPLGMAFAFFGVMVAVFGVYMGASFAPTTRGCRSSHPGRVWTSSRSRCAPRATSAVAGGRPGCSGD